MCKEFIHPLLPTIFIHGNRCPFVTMHLRTLKLTVFTLFTPVLYLTAPLTIQNELFSTFLFLHLCNFGPMSHF